MTSGGLRSDNDKTAACMSSGHRTALAVQWLQEDSSLWLTQRQVPKWGGGGALAPPWADAWPLPGQGSLQLLLFLGQLHLELSDLGLQLGDLVIEVGGVPFQLPTSLLQLLTLLLLSSEVL